LYCFSLDDVSAIGPCEINDIVESYSLQLPTEKVYIKHGNKYRLNCKAGWNTGSEMRAYVDVSCSDGNLQIDKSCEYCLSFSEPELVMLVFCSFTYLCIYFFQVIHKITENKLLKW